MSSKGNHLKYNFVTGGKFFVSYKSGIFPFLTYSNVKYKG